MKPFRLVFHRVLFLDRFFSLSTPGHWVVSLLAGEYLTTSTLMILSCFSFTADNSESSFYRLQQWLITVRDWMTTNKLKLSPEKTEFLLIGHERQRLKYFSTFPITLLRSEIRPSKTAKNLGIVFDENFNFRTHINNVCKLSYYHIRDLRRIRKHSDLDQAKCLASALVSSRLDYCNSLLHGVAVRDMLKLQRVQKCLARVVTRAGRLHLEQPPLSLFPLVTRFLQNSVQNIHLNLQDPLFW